jgi:hypothetical protein
MASKVAEKSFHNKVNENYIPYVNINVASLLANSGPHLWGDGAASMLAKRYFRDIINEYINLIQKDLSASLMGPIPISLSRRASSACSPPHYLPSGPPFV